MIELNEYQINKLYNQRNIISNEYFSNIREDKFDKRLASIIEYIEKQNNNKNRKITIKDNVIQQYYEEFINIGLITINELKFYLFLKGRCITKLRPDIFPDREKIYFVSVPFGSNEFKIKDENFDEIHNSEVYNGVYIYGKDFFVEKEYQNDISFVRNSLEDLKLVDLSTKSSKQRLIDKIEKFFKEEKFRLEEEKDISFNYFEKDFKNLKEDETIINKIVYRASDNKTVLNVNYLGTYGDLHLNDVKEETLKIIFKKLKEKSVIK